jgi:type I restriction-modification system DNA methylase subunit
MKEFLIETLTKKFDSESYQKFVLEFFNDLVPNIRELDIHPGYASHIDSLKLIGEYADPAGKKMHILEVRLKTHSKLENARTAQRNIVAKHIKDHWLDGALVAFYTPGSSSWRLSFVKIEYKFDAKGKTKEELTPPKRYSFLVGVNEPSHTAQQQLLPLVKETDYNPTLEQVEDAFSVEKVTKEFFAKYKELFEITVRELNKNHTFKNEASKNNIVTENFTKKLLGQIVFLYFLQKKGWLGVQAGQSWGDGDRNFLRQLFEDSKTKGKNFFNDYLEILFYDTLNNPRRNTTDPSFSKYFNCRIPFLNGGLFEPEYDWQNSFIYLDDDIFEKILNVFDLYNFTVKEDEPLEKEVAVDPEMLGKVFENLLEENLRKGKGTYYTPREIVHYMCQESLINHLVTETKTPEKKIRTLVTKDMVLTKEDVINAQKSKESKSKAVDKVLVFWEEEAQALDKILSDIKVVDPACGSGAFLVGMLQEIVKARQVLQMFTDDSQVDEYHLKKETIQNCIYGVDIDPGAVEIAKLRLWLSLVVDYSLEEIEPLPNLDYKIMQGNSLLEELVLGDTSIKLFNNQASSRKRGVNKQEFQEVFQERLSLGDKKIHEESKEKLLEKYKKLQINFFNESDHTLKKKIKEQLGRIETDLIEQSVKSEIEQLDYQNKGLGNYLIPGLGMTKKDAEKFQKNLSKQAQIMNVLDEFKKSGIKPFFLWRLYFADVFESRDGFDIVIANPPYVFTRGSGFTKEFKRAIKENYKTGFGKLNLFSLFIEQGLMLLKHGGNLIFIVPNTLFRATPYKPLRKFIVENYWIKQIVDLQEGIFEGVTASTTIIEINHDEIKGKTEIIDSMHDLHNGNISRKIEQSNFNNEEYVFSIFIEEGKNALFNKLDDGSVKFGSLCKDIINGIVTPKGKTDFISNKKISEKYKPFLEGKDIDSYIIRTKNKYILFDRKKLHRPRPDYVWEAKEKLIIRRIGGGNKALYVAYDDENYYTFASTNLILLKDKIQTDIKYILALLNSKLINFYYIEKFTNRSSLTVNVSKTYLDLLPIKVISLDKQKPIITLVDKILTLTKADDYLQDQPKQKKVQEYQEQIDKMVFELYNLNKDEVKIIQNL